MESARAPPFFVLKKELRWPQVTAYLQGSSGRQAKELPGPGLGGGWPMTMGGEGNEEVLLMEEIPNNHLEWLKPYKSMG